MPFVNFFIGRLILPANGSIIGVLNSNPIGGELCEIGAARKIEEEEAMKQTKIRFLLLVLLLTLTVLAGCSGPGGNPEWNASGAVPVYLTEWPENEYTAQIPKPASGEMDYILDFSDSGRYALYLKNISEEESAQYIEELKKHGFSVRFSEGNDQSVGTMLEKGKVSVNIAYTDGCMGVMIMTESD